MAAGGTPKVSVIVPVYNCRASLGRALASVFGQTLGAGRIEVIAVDDGSTDGGGAELDRLAAQHPQLRVLHQANSGGPGAPRNAGLEQASGEYLFFLDADDYFAPEALERLCAMADEHGTDVVLGQCAGVNRRPPKFPHDIARTSVPESPFVYDTLSPLKLFRRSRVERLGLRFVEGVSSHEDQLFTARAYFGADGLSVLAGYDCYYWVAREDGTSALQQGGAEDSRYWPIITEVMSFTGDQAGPGPLRDRLMQRHFRYEIFPRFGARYLAQSPAARAETRAGAKPLVNAWYTEGVAACFGPRARLLGHCLANDLDEALDDIAACGLDGTQPPTIVDKDRAFSAYPHFRDPALGIPDACCDITDRLRMTAQATVLDWRGNVLEIRGTAAIAGIEPDAQTVELRLRSKDEVPVEHRFPAARSGAEFRVTLDPMAREPLAKGHWEAHLDVRVQEIVHTCRLTGADDLEIPAGRLGRGGLLIAPYVAPGHRSLTLRLTPGGSLAQLLTVDEVTWEGRTLLRVHGRLPSALPPGHPVSASILLRRRNGDELLQGTAVATCDGDSVEVTAKIGVRGTPSGTWDSELVVDIDGGTIRGRIPVPGLDLPPPVTYGLLRRARPYATDRERLSVRLSGAVG